MDKQAIFKDFASVMEAEVLDQSQMDSLEGGAKCEGGCKKACMGGGQNSTTRLVVPTIKNENAFRDSASRMC